MKDLVQRLRQPSDFYFADQMTAKKANALYTSLLQDGADAIEALETKCAMQKGLIDGFVTVNNRLEAENAALKAELDAMRDQKPVAYRFTENRGNGNTEFNYYGLDEVGMAYRDNCLEITALYAAPGAKP